MSENLCQRVLSEQRAWRSLALALPLITVWNAEMKTCIPVVKKFIDSEVAGMKLMAMV